MGKQTGLSMALHDPHIPGKTGTASGQVAFAAVALPVNGSVDTAFLRVAGLTIAERQRRQLLHLGAESVNVAAEGEHLAGFGPVLLIESGLVADERLIAAFLAEARHRGEPQIAIGPDGRPGGLGWLPEGSARLDWDVLVRRAGRIDLAGQDTYAPDRRRHVPLLWDRPLNGADARRTGAELLAAAQKGCLDWPARFVHPRIENAVVRMLLPLPITPNVISVIALLLGLYAAWAFATGALWTGLLIVLAIGPIDGIDGKLARTRVEFSRWGDLEHVGDKIVEYGCFAGLAAAFGTAAAWALAALIVFAALAEAVQGEFYRRMTGAQLDDAGQFERAFRLVSGRRNTFFWTLLPFAWFGAWWAGLIAITVYAVVNFFIMQARFFVRLAEYGRANAPAIAANLDRTAYRMLDVTPTSGDQAAGVDETAGSLLPPTGRLGAS